MSSVYRAVEQQPELSLELIVTGAHLSPRFGMTVNEIRKDRFRIAEEIQSLVEGDRDVDRVRGAGIQLERLSQAVDRIRPDLLLVFGDREEPMMMAIVGTYLNIPVAHISGGDRVIGNADDHIRHAITKLAHLHMTTNEESRARILKMGEQPFRVFNVGNPGLDRLTEVPPMTRNELLTWHGFKKEEFHRPILLVIQHAISSEIDQSYAQMKATMEAVVQLEMNTVISHPNSDAGNFGIVRCLQEYERLPFVKIHKNIPRSPFVNTMRQAFCMLGNSSAGLIEAPFLKLPAVNVGNRQKARLHAENILFVPHETSKICEAVRKSCFDEAYRRKVSLGHSPYGDGKSSERIAKILAEVSIDENLLLKDTTY